MSPPAMCRGKSPPPSPAEAWVRGLLKLFGGFGVLAIVPTLMPRSWLAVAVEWAEPGTPMQLLVEYLARALSALCVLLGGMLCLSATDIPRYRPMIYWMAAFLLVVGWSECILLGLAPYPKNLIWAMLIADGGIVGLFGMALLILLPRVSHQPPPEALLQGEKEAPSVAGQPSGASDMPQQDSKSAFP